MMNKLIGYILSVVGIIGLAAYTVPFVRSYIPLPPQIDDTILVIISSVLVIVGLFLALKGGSPRRKKGAEVPIYSGKDIVGYRRMK
ncbi:MAG: hypothetical protein AABX73_03120 [Nanoarchaeota archaeon]